MGEQRGLFQRPFAVVARHLFAFAGVAMFVTAFCGTAARGGSEEWVAVGPAGGNFIEAVVDPSDASRVTAITSNPGRAYRSTNAGDNWVLFGEIRWSYLNDASAFSPSRLYAITPTECHRSSDGGSTWNASTYVSGGGMYGLVMCAHPTDSSIVYVVGERIESPVLTKTVLFKSTDGGQSWSNSDLFSDKHITPRDVTVSQTNPDVIYVAGRGSLVRSTDGGTSWTDLTGLIPNSTNVSFDAVVVDPADGNRIYVAGNHFYRSLDGGASWESHVSWMNIWAIAIDPTDHSRLYAGGYNWMYTSTDYGENWTRQNRLFESPIRHLEVAPTAGSTVYASTAIGLFRSTNAGVDWSEAYNGVFCSVVPTLAVAPSRPSTVFAQHKWKGVTASANGGDGWQYTERFPGCEDILALLVSATSPSVVLAVGEYMGPDGGVYRSEDGGNVWERVSEDLDFRHSLAADPSNPDVIYAGGRSSGFASGSGMSVWKSIDGGETWGAPVLLASGGGWCRDVAVAPSDSQVVYGAGTVSWLGGVLRSADGGSTWTDATGNLSDLHPGSWGAYAVCVLPGSADEVAVGTVVEYIGGGVFVTTNGGASWSATGLAESTRALVYDESAGVLYAATQSAGVYRSPDRGLSWQAINDGLGRLNCLCLDIDPVNGILYVGTDGGGVYRRGTREPSAAQGWRRYGQ